MEIVKQLSVFLENKPGALFRLTQDFAENDIDILAISIGDASDHAVVRIVVDKPTKALHLMGETGVLAIENELLQVKSGNEPGKLAAFCKSLTDMGINMEYAYGSAASCDDSVNLYVRVQDPQKALEQLKDFA